MFTSPDVKVLSVSVKGQLDQSGIGKESETEDNPCAVFLMSIASHGHEILILQRIKWKLRCNKQILYHGTKAAQQKFDFYIL